MSIGSDITEERITNHVRQILLDNFDEIPTKENLNERPHNMLIYAILDICKYFYIK